MMLLHKSVDLFHKPLSEMTNQEINALLMLNNDAAFDLQAELNLLRARDEALRREIDKRSGVLRSMRDNEGVV